MSELEQFRQIDDMAEWGAKHKDELCGTEPGPFAHAVAVQPKPEKVSEVQP
jgi:hypothetical protein